MKLSCILASKKRKGKKFVLGMRIIITPSELVIHWNDSLNSGKHYPCNYSFIIKDANLDHPNEETHRARSTCALPLYNQLVTLLAHQCIWL
jgi:hypothetical protein